MASRSKLNPLNWFRGDPAEVAAPRATPTAEPLPDEPPEMTAEEMQAEIGRLAVLIPQCRNENLRAKYQREIDALILRAQS